MVVIRAVHPLTAALVEAAQPPTTPTKHHHNHYSCLCRWWCQVSRWGAVAVRRQLLLDRTPPLQYLLYQDGRVQQQQQQQQLAALPSLLFGCASNLLAHC